MTMSSATRSGKCQICERTIKLDDHDLLWRHGHRNDGLHRNAQCPGSYRAPAPAVNALESEIVRLRTEDATRYIGLIRKYERRIASLTGSTA
jgi:hypothetical protein